MPKQLARAGHNRPWTHQNLVRICRITPTYDLKSCRFRIPLSCEKPHEYWVARVIQDRLFTRHQSVCSRSPYSKPVMGPANPRPTAKTLNSSPISASEISLLTLLRLAA